MIHHFIFLLVAVLSESTVIYTFNSAQLTPNEIFLSQSISGLYALQTQKPSIWINFKGWKMNEVWIHSIKQQNSDITFNDSYSNQSLNGLITLTNNLILSSNNSFTINNYIYANINDETFHYALSLAFHYNAIIATDTTTSNALKSSPLNLKLVRNFSAETHNSYINIFNEFISYGGDINKFITLQDIKKYQHLSDMVIATKSFIFWQNATNTSIMNYILQNISSTNKNAKRMLGWGPDEFHTVKIASQNTLSVIATDWASNMAQFYTIKPSMLTKKYENNPKSIHKTDSYHYVSFLWSDGDNVQWLMNGFFNEQWYGSPLKGQFPVSWTVSGSVQELAPVIYNEIISNATVNDSLVMAPSGWGYNYISDVNDIKQYSFETVNSIQMETNNVMNNINFIDDWKHKNNFSENVNIFLNGTNGNIKSILYYWYVNYAGGNGSIFWSKNNIPIITSKLRFWEGINNYSQIAEKVNNYAIDISSENGYSLIAVHAWSESMQNISKCIEMLKPHVKVVGVDDFVDLIIKNVIH